jgi:hypothetical protein
MTGTPHRAALIGRLLRRVAIDFSQLSGGIRKAIGLHPIANRDRQTRI